MNNGMGGNCLNGPPQMWHKKVFPGWGPRKFGADSFITRMGPHEGGQKVFPRWGPRKFGADPELVEGEHEFTGKSGTFA